MSQNLSQLAQDFLHSLDPKYKGGVVKELRGNKNPTNEQLNQALTRAILDESQTQEEKAFPDYQEPDQQDSPQEMASLEAPAPKSQPKPSPLPNREKRPLFQMK